MSGAKPFPISQPEGWKAYLHVKSNGGAAGVDAESIEAFEQDRKRNLYRLGNRLASGTYCSPPVREVGIPKRDGGERKLGIPTVTDRIAQTVVKRYLEPKVEPSFHGDSYGYRPGKSAVDAVGRARERCWQYDWVVDLDIRAFFDTLDHELVKRAVGKYTDGRGVLLSGERGLTAPIQREDGTLTARPAGTPQGGVVSPLLANIFLHLAFDTWMGQTFPPGAVRAVRGRSCATTGQRGGRDVAVRSTRCSLAVQGMRDGPLEPAGRAGSKPPEAAPVKSRGGERGRRRRGETASGRVQRDEHW